jgi:hypothetical protein
MHEKGPGGGLDPARMPGHRLMARLGKRVLRPGGRDLTEWMLERLDIGPDDFVLDPGGRLGLHGLALVPDDLEPPSREEISPRPRPAPLALLSPGRPARDEGALGALRFAASALRDPAAGRRVLAIRAVVRRHAGDLAAIALVARRPAEAAS